MTRPRPQLKNRSSASRSKMYAAWQGSDTRLSSYAKADTAPFDVSASFVQVIGDGESAKNLLHSSTAFPFTTDRIRGALMFDLQAIAGKALVEENETHLELLLPSGQTAMAHLAGMKLESGPFASPYRSAEPASESMWCCRYFRLYANPQDVEDLVNETHS